MTAAGPPEGDRREAWRQARRAAALRHHPDRGGETEELVRALAAVDREFGLTGADTAAPSPTVPRRLGRALRRRRHRARRHLRASREHLPRWVPGARRYVDLGGGGQ